jgi:hypothetical protein
MESRPADLPDVLPRTVLPSRLRAPVGCVNGSIRRAGNVTRGKTGTAR